MSKKLISVQTSSNIQAGIFFRINQTLKKEKSVETKVQGLLFGTLFGSTRYTLIDKKDDEGSKIADFETT